MNSYRSNKDKNLHFDLGFKSGYKGDDHFQMIKMGKNLIRIVKHE